MKGMFFVKSIINNNKHPVFTENRNRMFVVVLYHSWSKFVNELEFHENSQQCAARRLD